MGHPVYKKSICNCQPPATYYAVSGEHVNGRSVQKIKKLGETQKARFIIDDKDTSLS